MALQALRHEGYLIGPRPEHGIFSPQQCTESLRLAVGPLAHRILSHMNMASEIIPPSEAAAEDAVLEQEANDSEGGLREFEESSHVARTGLSSAMLEEPGSSSGGSSGSGSSNMGRGKDSSSSRAALLRGNVVGSAESDFVPSESSRLPLDSGSQSEDLMEGRELLPLAELDLRSVSATGSKRRVRSQSFRRLRRALIPLGQEDLRGGGGSSDESVQSSGVDGQRPQQQQQPLMYLFSGHDSTITPLLASECVSSWFLC